MTKHAGKFSGDGSSIKHGGHGSGTSPLVAFLSSLVSVLEGHRGLSYTQAPKSKFIGLIFMCYEHCAKSTKLNANHAIDFLLILSMLITENEVFRRSRRNNVHMPLGLVPQRMRSSALLCVSQPA